MTFIRAEVHPGFKDIGGMGKNKDTDMVKNTPQDALRGPVGDDRVETNGSGRVDEKLLHPSPLFNKFIPTDEKILALAKHLMENKYSLSDEYRDYNIIHAILHKYMTSNTCVFYEIGDMDGVLGLTDIIIGWKAHAIFELLNPKVWGKQLVRESRALFDLLMDTGELIKVSSQTADKRVQRMSAMIGFVIEGIKYLEFSWDRKPCEVYLLGRYSKHSKEE